MNEQTTTVDHEMLARFFRPDPKAAYDQIAAAHKHIREVSLGEVTRPELLSPSGKAERDGLCCARLFGPMEDDTCNCGGVRDDPTQRGSACPRCGVPIGPATMRDERWAHIDLLWPLLHPALASALDADRPKGIGAALWDLLLTACGTPHDLATRDDRSLLALPGVGPVRIKALRRLQAEPFPKGLMLARRWGP